MNAVSEAFDSDVLIYAANGLPSGMEVRRLIEGGGVFIGSVVLRPETLSKPFRAGNMVEFDAVERVLGQLDLKAVDDDLAVAATELAAKYRLQAADAIHLATAVVWGAARFHTNNRKHFGPHITEVQVVWPEG